MWHKVYKDTNLLHSFILYKHDAYSAQRLQGRYDIRFPGFNSTNLEDVKSHTHQPVVRAVFCPAGCHSEEWLLTRALKIQGSLQMES